MAKTKIMIHTNEIKYNALGKLLAIVRGYGLDPLTDLSGLVPWGFIKLLDNGIKIKPPIPKPPMIIPDTIPSLPGKNSQAWYSTSE